MTRFVSHVAPPSFENACCQRARGRDVTELASLERLGSLEAGLTKGRKHGLRVGQEI
jgi:hypothetical protein